MVKVRKQEIFDVKPRWGQQKTRHPMVYIFIKQRKISSLAKKGATENETPHGICIHIEMILKMNEERNIKPQMEYR